MKIIKFNFSKLSYFVKNYQTNSFQIGETATFIKSQQPQTNPIPNSNSKFFTINSDLQKLLQEKNSLNPEQLLEVFQNLYQHNYMITKQNKDQLLRHYSKTIKNNIGQNTLITIGQYSLQLNMVDDNIIDYFTNIFQTQNFKNIKIIQILDLQFVIILAMKKLVKTPKFRIFMQQDFQDKWKEMIQKLTEELDSNQQVFFEKYPHLSYILKVLVHDISIQDIQTKQIQNIIISPYLSFFEHLTSLINSKPNQILTYESKDQTILLSSFVNVNSCLNQENQKIIDKFVIQILQKINTLDLNKFTDHSLSALVQSLTRFNNLEYQKLFIKKVVEVIAIRLENQSFHPKFNLAILYEIYLRWEYRDSQMHEQLSKILNQVPLEELTDYDFAQFFHLLTLNTDPQSLFQQLKKVEKDFSKNRINKRNGKYDEKSRTRIFKSLMKISNNFPDYQDLQVVIDSIKQKV